MSFLPLVFGLPVFLFPVHIVFFEFVIDPACSIVFEAEKSDKDVMQRPPRDPREPLFSLQMLGVSLLLGASVLASICLAYWWAGRSGITAAEAASFGFAAIVFGNLAMIHSTRSRDRIALRAMMQSNPALWWITLGTLIALAAAIYIPPIADVFRFAPLSSGQLGLAVVAGTAGVLWYEAYKLLRPRRAAVLTER
jgi:Ca2+-transporting ATPase